MATSFKKLIKQGLQSTKLCTGSKKKCRRSKKKKNVLNCIKIMYANIQGFTGKKTSLQHTMNSLESDVVLLAETMVRKVSLDGCQPICPKESVGQNVAIILAGRMCSLNKMKLYEPNDTINMIGVRIEVRNSGIRLYTAHLKQQSTNCREDILSQFDEIRSQFRSANSGREGMLMIFDANVHVGSEGVNGCKDTQDWGGKMLLAMVKEEGLTIVNNLNVCKGIVTRVDPRNGTRSTIDLAICNTFMNKNIQNMIIDEDETWKLRKYGKKNTKTDHNTITVTFGVENTELKPAKMVVKRYNVKNVNARLKMKEVIEREDSLDQLFSNYNVDINNELNLFFTKWNNMIRESFEEIKPSKHIRRGVDPEVKELLKKESWIRANVSDSVEKGRAIFEIRKQISVKIKANLSAEVEEKVKEIVQSKQPQSKVFGVRRFVKKDFNIDFPLKDGNGVLQVSREGVDKIITNHFNKVFAQNGIPQGLGWNEYWGFIDQTFNLIDSLTSKMYNVSDEPVQGDIDKIIQELNSSKSSYGNMSIDLVKLGGVKLSQIIFRCILMCYRKNILPDALRDEKMTLLLKNRGIIDNLNDYRGIFLRNIIISIYQKWLYKRNSEKVDSVGSEFACGGRKKRSGLEALLIVKLMQDYAKWAKKKLVIKFLDVEKFFDKINYKVALIEAFKCGVTGRDWQCYKTINSKKTCIPHIPSGTCSQIEVNNVFVQGSCDAVLVAWPLMDADSKREGDCFSSNFYVEGIQINRLSFVDDLIEFNQGTDEANEKSIDSEVFEKKTRLNFKVPKCKVMTMNCPRNSGVSLNGELLDEVKEHIYLGTIISSNGERFAEMNDRIIKSNSVVNEIVQICKKTELSTIRLHYVNMLMNSCLDWKLKYGCALWNITKYKNTSEKLNRIKPDLLKKVLELPSSTPSDAIQYEFGVNDLTLDILMEKVILAVLTLKSDETRISRQLLSALMSKNVPGFCSEVIEACGILEVSLDELAAVDDIRKFLKKKVVKIQARELLKRMTLGSKMDRVIVNGFSFDGSMKSYLLKVNYIESQAIFMTRYRMWPTKVNFPGRWGDELSCNVCGSEDNDEHIFLCPGYCDLIIPGTSLRQFFDENVMKDNEKLKLLAEMAIKLIERMKILQKV